MNVSLLFFSFFQCSSLCDLFVYSVSIACFCVVACSWFLRQAAS